MLCCLSSRKQKSSDHDAIVIMFLEFSQNDTMYDVKIYPVCWSFSIV